MKRHAGSLEPSLNPTTFQPARSSLTPFGRLDRHRLTAAAMILTGLIPSSATTGTAASLPFTSVDAGPVSSLQDQVYSAAWGDYDRDGRPDLFLSTLFNAPAAFFRNTPSGFERMTDEPLGAGLGSRAGAVWFDADNNGRLDLFVATTAAEDDALLVAQESGGFTRRSEPPFVGSGGYGQSAMTFDFDRDGRADLFVPNGGGWQPEANLLLRNLGAEQFSRITEGAVAAEVLHSVGAAAGDYDGDGWPDLFVANIWGPGSLFRNRGDGTFQPVQEGPADPAITAPLGASTGTWADFDNDGDLDLLTPHGDGNPLYRNEGGRLVRFELPPLTTSTGACIGAVFADFDNDGWLDVIIANRNPGQLLFRNTGDGGFERIDSGPIAERTTGANGVAVADYDLDGDLDVLLTNWEGGGSPSLYRNDTTGNHWLTVKLDGTRSNRDGIGAVVRVKATIHGRTFWQMRSIGGHDAQGSQELVAHFGLGDAASVESLRVEWPSGFVQTLPEIAANQSLTLREHPVTALGTLRLDRQTGLYEQVVRLDYALVNPTNAARIYIEGLPPDTTLVNATGTDAFGPFVQAPRSWQVTDGTARFVLKFYRATRGHLPQPTFSLRYLEAPTPDIPVGDRFAVSGTQRLPDGSQRVEFEARAGSRYRIEYSADNAVWSTVPSEIIAGGSKVVWIDHGPPDTDQPPATATARFYRVVRVSPN